MNQHVVLVLSKSVVAIREEILQHPEEKNGRDAPGQSSIVVKQRYGEYDSCTVSIVRCVERVTGDITGEDAAACSEGVIDPAHAAIVGAASFEPVQLLLNGPIGMDSDGIIRRRSVTAIMILVAKVAGDEFTEHRDRHFWIGGGRRGSSCRDEDLGHRDFMDEGVEEFLAAVECIRGQLQGLGAARQLTSNRGQTSHGAKAAIGRVECAAHVIADLRGCLLRLKNIESPNGSESRRSVRGDRVGYEQAENDERGV